MTSVLTPEEAAAALHRLGDQIESAAARPLRPAFEQARAEAERGYRSRGIGRALFGGGRSLGADDPQLIVTVRADDGKATLASHGMAALIEQAGHTDPHEIAPIEGGVLAGGLLHPVAEEIRHPGSRVTQDPQLQQAFDRLVARLPASVDGELQRAIEAVGL